MVQVSATQCTYIRIFNSISLIANVITIVFACYNCYIYFYKQRIRTKLIILFYIFVFITVIAFSIKIVLDLIDPNHLAKQAEGLIKERVRLSTLKITAFTALYWIIALSMY